MYYGFVLIQFSSVDSAIVFLVSISCRWLLSSSSLLPYILRFSSQSSEVEGKNGEKEQKKKMESEIL